MAVRNLGLSNNLMDTLQYFQTSKSQTDTSDYAEAKAEKVLSGFEKNKSVGETGRQGKKQTMLR